MSIAAEPLPRIRFPGRIKLLLSLLLAITVVTGLLAYILSGLFQGGKTTYVRDLTALVAAHAADNVNATLQGYHQHLESVGRLLQDRTLPPQEKTKRIETLFDNMPDFLSVSVYRGKVEEGHAFSARALQAAHLTQDELAHLFVAQPLPFERVGNGRPFVLNTTFKPTAPVFTLTAPLVVDGARLIATATIDLRTLLRVPQDDGIFDVYVMDNDGNVLASKDERRIAARAPPDWLPLDTLRLIVPLAQGRAAAISAEYVARDIGMVGGFANIELTNMIVGVEIPSSAAHHTVQGFLNGLTRVSVTLLVISALLSLIWSRRIARPVKKLSHAALKIGQGDFGVHVDVRGNDEMGELARSFNRMAAELHRRDEALKQAQAALVQSEKMAAFGQLSAGIAHEVKNPLAGILGYAQLSMRKLDKDSPVYRHLSLIEKETKRCKTIIDNLMKFARQEAVEMQASDLNQTVEEACVIVDHQLGLHHVRLHKELGADLPPFMGNANQIEQVLVNLMINAGQAMEEKGGTVTLTTRLADTRTLEIRVSDTGPGIPEEIKAKLFEPFFTTKPAGKGTGLGLAVSYGIVRDHHGDIGVEDAEGHGACFVVTLPMALRPFDPAAAAGGAPLK